LLAVPHFFAKISYGLNIKRTKFLPPEKNSCHQKNIPVTRNELKSEEKFLAKEWNMPNNTFSFRRRKFVSPVVIIGH
jgi:hypothetical protein